MSDRHTPALLGRLFLVLCVAYVMGLVLFFPGRWGAGWIRALTPAVVQWQALALNGEGLHWKDVTVSGVAPLSRLVLSEVHLAPQWFALFRGDLAAAYRIRHEGGQVEGVVQWSTGALQVQWQHRVDDFSLFQAVFSLPAPPVGRGVGEGQVVLGRAPGVLRSGRWSFEGKSMALLGVELASLHIKGEIPKENRLKVQLSGKGNVALSGQVTLKVRGDLLEGSPVSGRVKIQPLSGRLQGAVGAVLGEKPATLVLGGTLGRPSWTLP